MRQILVSLTLLLTLALISGEAAQRNLSEPSAEEQILDEITELGRRGRLGFEWPEVWSYDYDPRFAACGSLGGSACVPVASETPMKDTPSLRTLHALTRRDINHTTFYRTSASPVAEKAVIYADPARGWLEATVIAPQAFSAREMAAYVIGHEVHGHIVNHLGADSNSEMQCNFYGLKAVRALRAAKILKK